MLTEDGWLLTGDVAQMDEDGYFRIIARKADMWYPARSAKKPAFPRDVEEVIYEVPQVRETAVVAVAGRPVAFVIAGRERPSADSIIAYCKRRLPPELRTEQARAGLAGILERLDDVVRELSSNQ